MNVLFAISASSSTAQVVWRPLYARFWAASRQQIFESGLTGSVSGLDVASLATGLFTSAWWFFNRHASYAWALQDLFGVCLVVLFLGVIRLSNIKVATLLLSMAFAYDIFFVFISPVFFSESVMVKVATGDGPTQDPDYCEKCAARARAAPTRSRTRARENLSLRAFSAGTRPTRTARRRRCRWSRARPCPPLRRLPLMIITSRAR